MYSQLLPPTASFLPEFYGNETVAILVYVSEGAMLDFVLNWLLPSETWNPHPSLRRVGGNCLLPRHCLFFLGSCQPWQHLAEHHDTAWVRGFSSCSEIEQTHFQEGLGPCGFWSNGACMCEMDFQLGPLIFRGISILVGRGIVPVSGRLNGSYGLAISKHATIPLTTGQIVREPLGVHYWTLGTCWQSPNRKKNLAGIYTGRLYMGWPPPSEPTGLTTTRFYDIMMLPPLRWWSQVSLKGTPDTPHDSWHASYGIFSLLWNDQWPMSLHGWMCPSFWPNILPIVVLQMEDHHVQVWHLQSFCFVGTISTGERVNLNTGKYLKHWGSNLPLGANRSWDYKTNLPQVSDSDPHHGPHGWNLCNGKSAQQPPGHAPEVRVAAWATPEGRCVRTSLHGASFLFFLQNPIGGNSWNSHSQFQYIQDFIPFALKPPSIYTPIFLCS